MSLRRTAAAIAPALLIGATATAEVLRVNHAAAGANNGVSWPDAFTDLQTALAIAQPGDEIWVAAGTYHPTGAADRAVSFALREAVGLYGGFAGAETALEQRDVLANVTILSGDLNEDDLPDFGNTSDNSYHVVVAHMVCSDTILDGFTIVGGHADGPGLGPTPESKDQGSGINIYHGRPVVRYCTLLHNWASNHGAVNDHGGATFSHCEFRENHSAQFGAGLYIHHDSQTSASHCHFVDNVAEAEGGGAYSRSMHGATLHDCRFEGNRAQRGAGMYHASESMTHVSSCEFRANHAELGGGGVYTDIADPLIENCYFYQNKAGEGISDGGAGGGGSGGGGVFSSDGTPTIERCIFVENLASFGGGVYFSDGSDGLTRDCVFVRGVAEEAGGLYTLGAPVTVERCLFVENRAQSGQFSVGGGLSTYFADSVVSECTFIENFAELGGGGLYNEGSAAQIVGCRFFHNSSFGEIGWGGGLMNGYIVECTVANCTFTGNSANRGGAIVNMFSALADIVNCTITGNSAAIDGGAVANIDGAESRIANCILWNDAPNEIGGAPIDARYLCIEGGFPGQGNIFADPRFIDADGPDDLPGTEDDDLRLSADSPCIDAGSNLLAAAGVTIDLAAAPRFADQPFVVDSGDGPPPLVDIGAFEVQPCIGDIDGDHSVDLSDLAVVLIHFGQAQSASWSDGDVTGDHAVALDDLAALLSRFGLDCE